MDLSYWEQQFSLRQVLPDFQAWLDLMQQESDAVAKRWQFERTAYGPDPRQWFELSGQVGQAAIFPVFIHGGYWRALEAERHRFVLPSLMSAAGGVANVEYRLLPDVTLAQIVEDVQSALRVLAAQTGARLYLVGHSAGGHLAVMGALREPQIVAGACAISGLFDLEPLPHSFLAQEVGLRAQDVVGLSPQHLWTGRAERITVAVGAQETPEFLRQSYLFAASHSARLMEVPDTHHMSVLGSLSEGDGHLAKQIEATLKEIEE